MISCGAEQLDCSIEGQSQRTQFPRLATQEQAETAAHHSSSAPSQ